MDLVARIVSTDFMPHGYCFLWLPEILWLHVVSDAVIAVSYFAIPAALLFLLAKRREVPFPGMLLMFAGFIVACGTTHLMSIWTIWQPDYGVEGLVKAATALISAATAIMLIPVLPRALALRSPAELESVNQRLVLEVGDHERTAQSLRLARTELEDRVAARTAELAASEARYRALVEALAAMVWTTRVDGMLDDIPAWRAVTGQSVEEVRGFGWLEALHPDDRAPTLERWLAATRIGTSYDTEYRVRHADGHYHWYNARGVPVREADGNIREFVGLCIDIDARKRAEASRQRAQEHQSLLLAELNHRVKNTLATVQSIAVQSLNDERPRSEARELFLSRLLALGHTHSLLSVNDWHGASLAGLVANELAAYPAQTSHGGPDLVLVPKAAVTLGLLLHELTVNAVKYGALSVAEGRVEIRWTAQNDRLALVWQEAGGPAVAPPGERRGFGRTLLERAISYDLHGSAILAFERSGVRYELSVPLAETVGERPEPERMAATA